MVWYDSVVELPIAPGRVGPLGFDVVGFSLNTVDLIAVVGVYPEPLLRRIEPTVLELLRTIEEREAVALAAGPAPVELSEGPGSETAR